jgi:hypothetical protein
MAGNEQRCWPGYEPVKGKKQHEEGSCRPKADSKLAPSEKGFCAKRQRQLEEWKKEHPGSPRKAAQHLHSPDAKAPAKQAAKKKATTATKRTRTKPRKQRTTTR